MDNGSLEKWLVAELNLSALAFRDGGETMRLGGWAPFLADLGAAVARHAVMRGPLRIAVALPTRSYASAFVALGVGEQVRALKPQASASAHFAMLANLPKGTRVRRIVGPELVPRTVHGVTTDRAEPYLVLSGGPAREFLPARACLGVQPMEVGADFTRRRKLIANPGFVRTVLSATDLGRFAGSTSADVVIVGPIAKLRREMVDTELVALSGAASEEGCLNDLLRCDAFASNSNDHDRTVVVSSTSESSPPQDATVVVFDGSVGFLRKRARCANSSWIVLLDRRSASAVAAADAFNNALARSRGPVSLDLKLSVPPGIELAGFV